MKNKNVTFSMPLEIISQLHTTVPKKGLSQFVAKAIAKALEEENAQLKADYIASTTDTERNKTIAEWDELEVEGWDD